MSDSASMVCASKTGFLSVPRQWPVRLACIIVLLLLVAAVAGPWITLITRMMSIWCAGFNHQALPIGWAPITLAATCSHA